MKETNVNVSTVAIAQILQTVLILLLLYKSIFYKNSARASFVVTKQTGEEFEFLCWTGLRLLYRKRADSDCFLQIP